MSSRTELYRDKRPKEGQRVRARVALMRRRVVATYREENGFGFWELPRPWGYWQAATSTDAWEPHEETVS